MRKGSELSWKGKVAEMTDYAFFLGCITPNRYPGIEVASKKVMKEFGINLLDMKGASCCPAPGVFGSFDLATWLTLACRNLVIAEEMNVNIATTCNGCYATLQEANHLLKHDQKLKDRVNDSLAKVGKQYKGTIEVKHVIELLSDEIKFENIQKKVRQPLKGVKAAVHYGCHFLKPSETRMHGPVERPSVLNDLVKSLGAENVDYKDRAVCCGAGGGVRAAMLDVALDMAAEKIDNVITAGADCLVTPCAFCHLQFDRGQVELNEKFGKKYQLPIVFVTQLAGLALGMDAKELGFYDNAISTESLLKKIP
jgi:heterodisulfide reductase subunit B